MEKEQDLQRMLENNITICKQYDIVLFPRTYVKINSSILKT